MSPTPFNVPLNAKIIAKHGNTFVYALRDGRLAFLDQEKNRLFLDGSRDVGSGNYGNGHNSSWADSRLARAAAKGGSSSFVKTKALRPKQSQSRSGNRNAREENTPDMPSTGFLSMLPKGFLDWADAYQPGDPLPPTIPGYGDSVLCNKSVNDMSYSNDGIGLDDVVESSLIAMGLPDINPALAFSPEPNTKSMPKFETKGILGREIRDMARNIADSILTARGLWKDELNKIRCGSGPNANRFTNIFGDGCDMDGGGVAQALVSAARSGASMPGSMDGAAGKIEGAREGFADFADSPGSKPSFLSSFRSRLTGVRGGHTPHYEGDSPMSELDPAAGMGPSTLARPSKRWNWMGVRSLVSRNKQRERKKKAEATYADAQKNYAKFLDSAEYKNWAKDFTDRNGRLPNAGEKIHQYARSLGWKGDASFRDEDGNPLVDEYGREIGSFMGLADTVAIDGIVQPDMTHFDAMVEQIVRDNRLGGSEFDDLKPWQQANRRKEVSDMLEEYALLTLHGMMTAGGPKQIEITRPDGTKELVDNPEHKRRFAEVMPTYFRIKHYRDPFYKGELGDAMVVASVNSAYETSPEYFALGDLDPTGINAMRPLDIRTKRNGATPAWAQQQGSPPFFATISLDAIWFSDKRTQAAKMQSFDDNHLGMSTSRESVLLHTADHELNHIDDFAHRLGLKLGYGLLPNGDGEAEWLERLSRQKYDPISKSWTGQIDLMRDAIPGTFLHAQIMLLQDRLTNILSPDRTSPNSEYLKRLALWQFYMTNFGFNEDIQAQFARWLAFDVESTPGGARLTKAEQSRLIQEIRDNLMARGYGEETGIPQLKFWSDMLDRPTGTWNPVTRTFEFSTDPRTGDLFTRPMNLMGPDDPRTRLAAPLDDMSEFGAEPWGQARLDNSVSNLIAGFMGGTYSGYSDNEFAAELRTHLNKPGALAEIREFLADKDRNIHGLDESNFMTLVAKYVGQDEVYRLYGEKRLYTPTPRDTDAPGPGPRSPSSGGGGGGTIRPAIPLGPGPTRTPPTPGGGGGGPTTPPSGGGAPRLPGSAVDRPTIPTVPRADEPPTAASSDRRRPTASEARDELNAAREKARDRRLAEREEADRRAQEASREAANNRAAEARADEVISDIPSGAQLQQNLKVAQDRQRAAERRHNDALRKARSTGADPDRGGDGDRAAWDEYRAAYEELTEADIETNRISRELEEIRNNLKVAQDRQKAAETRHNDALRKARSTGADPDRGGDGDRAAWDEYRAAYEELMEADSGVSRSVLQNTESLGRDIDIVDEEEIFPNAPSNEGVDVSRPRTGNQIKMTNQTTGEVIYVDENNAELMEQVRADGFAPDIRQPDAAARRSANRQKKPQSRSEGPRTKPREEPSWVKRERARRDRMGLADDIPGYDDEPDSGMSSGRLRGTSVGDERITSPETRAGRLRGTSVGDERITSPETRAGRLRGTSVGDGGSTSPETLTTSPKTRAGRLRGRIGLSPEKSRDMFAVARTIAPGIEKDMPSSVREALESGKIVLVYRTAVNPGYSGEKIFGTWIGRPGSVYLLHEDGRVARYGREGEGWTDLRESVNFKIQTQDDPWYFDRVVYSDGKGDLPKSSAEVEEKLESGEYTKDPKPGLHILELKEQDGKVITTHSGDKVSDIYRNDGTASFFPDLGVSRNRRSSITEIDTSDVSFTRSLNGDVVPRTSRRDERSRSRLMGSGTTERTVPPSRLRGTSVGDGGSTSPETRAGRLRGTSVGEDASAGMGPTYDKFLEDHSGVVDQKQDEIAETKRVLSPRGRRNPMGVTREEAEKIASTVEELFSGEMRIDRNVEGSLMTELASKGRGRIAVRSFVNPDLVSVNPNGNLRIAVSMQITSPNGKYNYGNASRYIEVGNDGINVEHATLTINSAYRGLGVASEFNARNENLYKAIGVRSITASGSSSSSPDSDNPLMPDIILSTGATHWARNGFTWRDDEAKNRFISVIDGALTNRPGIFTEEERNRIGSMYKKNRDGTFQTDFTPEDLVDFEGADRLFAEEGVTIAYRRDLTPFKARTPIKSRLSKIADRSRRRSTRQNEEGQQVPDRDPEAEMNAARGTGAESANVTETIPDWIEDWDPEAEISSAQVRRDENVVFADGSDAGMSRGGTDEPVVRTDGEGRPLTSAASPQRSGTATANYEANVRGIEDDYRLVESEINALEAAIRQAEATGEWRGADWRVHFGDTEPNQDPKNENPNFALLTRTAGGTKTPRNLSAEETKQKKAILSAKDRLVTLKKEQERLARVGLDKRTRSEQNVLDVEDIPAEELEQLLVEAEDIKRSVAQRRKERDRLRNDPIFASLNYDERESAINVELDRMGMPDPLSPGEGQLAAIHVGSDTLENGVLDPGFTAGDESMRTGGGNTGSLNQMQIQNVLQRRDNTAKNINAAERILQQIKSTKTTITPEDKTQADILNGLTNSTKFSAGESLDLGTANSAVDANTLSDRIAELLQDSIKRNSTSLAKQDAILKRINESPRFGFVSAYPLVPEGTVIEGYFGRNSGKKVPANIGTFLTEVEQNDRLKRTADGFVDVKDRPMLERWKRTLRGTQWLAVGGEDTIVMGLGTSPGDEAQIVGINEPVFGFSFGVASAANYRSVLSDIGMALAARAVSLRRSGEEVTQESVMLARRKVETSRIIMLARSGATIEEITQKTGRSYQFVRELLKLAGVEAGPV